MLGNEHETGEKKIKKMNVDPIVETSPEPATGTDGWPHGEPPNGTDRLRGMQDTNAVLQIRYERLRLSMAQLRLSRMRTWCTRYQLQNQMDEIAHLFYDIWNGWVRRRTFEGIHAFAMSRRGEKHLPQLHSSTYMVALHCLHVALHSIAFSPAVRCYSLQCMHKGMIVRRFVTEQKKQPQSRRIPLLLSLLLLNTAQTPNVATLFGGKGVSVVHATALYLTFELEQCASHRWNNNVLSLWLCPFFG